MSPSVALSSNLLKNNTPIAPSPNSRRRKSLHFTPIIPKRKLSINSVVSTGDSDHSLNSPNKRYNRSNSAAGPSTGSVISTIKTSRKWVLPPRPKPGRKTFFNGSNNHDNSETNTNSNNVVGKGHDKNSPNSPTSTSSVISSTSSSSATSSVFSNTNKRRTHSVPIIPHVKGDSNNNILNKTNLSKKNSNNYLAFLKFDDETSTLNLSLAEETVGKQSFILSAVSTHNEHAATSVTPNNFSVVPSSDKDAVKTTAVSSAVSTISSTSTALQREPSPTETVMTTPLNDMGTSLNKLHTFTFNNENISSVSNNGIFQEFNIDYNYNMSSTLLSSFASNPSSRDNIKNPENNDSFIEKTTNDELENEIYNNIWKFLPRYNKTVNGTADTNGNEEGSANNNENANNYSSNSNKNGSTNPAANDIDSYFYSAPTLEELMDEQDNSFNNFNNFSFSLQDLP